MKQNKKGFTLAELLIVVAIIAVLVAISIPIFNNQLKKARLATNQANARAAYAAWVAMFIDQGMPVKADNTYGSGQVRNFGAQVCKSSNNEPSIDISTWKTTTILMNHDRNLGAHVYKYWQIRVTDGQLTAYYAYENSTGDW